MRYLQLETTDPAFNLAVEEWILRHAEEDVFMLWRNAPSIIVGRNQNTRAQINEAFVQERGIPVVRRLSGGGAVFHDLGNVNFTFISVSGDGAMDFQRFTAPIVQALQGMGVACSFEGRNDLVIDGKKISGNAQYMHQNKVLHHGTLLFAATMTDLSGALRVNAEKYKDKAVQSVAKRVTNIAAHLPEPMEVEVFMDRLMRDVAGDVASNTGPGTLRLTPEEARHAGLLADRKYRAWDWNYGASPAYAFSRVTRTPGGLLEVHLDTDNGLITAARLLGDFFGRRDIAGLEALLPGCRHEREALQTRLADLPIEDYLRGVTLAELLDCMF
ncbi:lipoate--protein ligase [Megalodesulfovibrio paquesii]